MENIATQFKSLANSFSKESLALRKEALASFQKLGIPTTRHEEWKYTNIKARLRQEFSLLPAESRVNKAVKNYIASLPPYTYRLTFLNGVFHPELSIIPDLKGVTVCSLREAAAHTGGIVEKHFGRLVDYSQEHFAALNTAFVTDGAFIHIHKNVAVNEPIYLQYFFTATDEYAFVQTRNLVVLEEGASLSLAEDFRNASNIDVQYNHVAEMYVGNNARLDVVELQLEVSNAIGIHTLESKVNRNGRLSAATITFSSPNTGTGQSLIRNNLTARLTGEGAHAEFAGLYFGKENALIDNHVLIDHIAPNCTSNQLYKGVLSDEATGVFNGKIFVKPGAQKTNAYQSSKALLLSKGASVNSKPQLEIFADDVKCSHGAAIGQLDENALFYLMTRGVSRHEATQILTYAFAHEVVEHIQTKPIRQFLCDKLRDELHLNF
ncbi:MAG: Fe-S cluster assembly protein SufD [Chitinophagales bacterium]|nr:Fe-S cluster assembly protein SufD [Chitinophagales bacterium]MDW8419869.1 Fe-S cluster assembly protein SufD [Chitinophagales bacterium]